MSEGTQPRPPGATGTEPSAEPAEASTARAGEEASNADASDADRGASRGVLGGVLGFLREVVVVVVLALVLSVLAKTFLVQSFFIPSDSMNDTLIRDDRVVVSKLTPGPFDLARGDVVVFEDPGHWLRSVPRLPQGEGVGQGVKEVLTWLGILPSQEDNHLIKRVIGLPGDRVRCCSVDGKLEVNGQAITETYLFPGDAASTTPFDITVPAGKLWVMGDHRSDSADSRENDTNPDEDAAVTVPGAGGQPVIGTADPKDRTGYYGSVPIDKVVGRAVTIVWPLGRLAILGGQDGVFGQVPPPATAS